MSVSSYQKAVEEFNEISGFVITLPKIQRVYDKLIPFIADIKEKKIDLLRYEDIRKQGYSDDHLATQIGSFVLHLNQITNEVKINT